MYNNLSQKSLYEQLNTGFNYMSFSSETRGSGINNFKQVSEIFKHNNRENWTIAQDDQFLKLMNYDQVPINGMYPAKEVVLDRRMNVSMTYRNKNIPMPPSLTTLHHDWHLNEVLNFAEQIAICPGIPDETYTSVTQEEIPSGKEPRAPGCEIVSNTRCDACCKLYQTTRQRRKRHSNSEDKGEAALKKKLKNMTAKAEYHIKQRGIALSILIKISQTLMSQNFL